MSRPADHAVMRRVNRAAILDRARATQTVTRAELAAATGLAKPTVSLIIEDLIREGLMTEVGHGASGTVGGRPPALLAFNARSSYLVGVHIGVRRTTVIVADARGEPLEQRVVKTGRGTPKAALQSVARVVGEAAAAAGADTARIATVGVCLPGLVDAQGVLLRAPNLGWQGDVQVERELRELLGCPVVATNSVRGSLVAERHLGVAVDTDDVVVVYAGTGVGAAASVGGHLLRGNLGIAGEFGHVRVATDGAACNCGKRGCLETVASADAVVAAYTKGRERRGATAVSAADIAAAAADGDRRAIDVLATAGEALGAASAWLVNLFDPGCLVLAGGLAGAGPTFVEAFRTAVLRDALAQSAAQLRIETSALGQETEVLGALLLAREHAGADLRIVER